jgi:hypothetical protein
MTGRDRLVVICIAALLALAAVYVELVAPERKQAAKLGGEVSSADTQLTSAESKLASAREARAKYASTYASIVSLGKAVPPSEEVPALIWQLSRSSGRRDVEFSSITAGEGASGSSAPATAPASGGAAGFTQMPFTFVFEGGFFDLYHVLHAIDAYTTRTASGELRVRGRLLTVQSVKLAPASTSNPTNPIKPGTLTGTITATAYVLPAGEGLTGGGAPAAPSATTPASSASSSSQGSAATPAVAKVTP